MRTFKHDRKSPRPVAAGIIVALLMVLAIQPLVATADSWDWRDVDGRNYMTPAKAQGSAECSQFAGAATLEAKVKIALNDPDFEIDLSEEYMKVSIEFSNGYVQASDTGVALELDWPYNPTSDPANAGKPGWEDRAFTMDGFTTLVITSEEQQRVEIQNLVKTYGPLYVDIWWHSNTIVGYDDDAQYWIVRETYGPNSGDNGYYYYPYGSFEPEEPYGTWVEYIAGDVYLAGVRLTEDLAGTQYALSVANGSGSGSCPFGQWASISANPGAGSLLFDQWIGDTAMVSRFDSADTKVLMTANATVTATYVQGYPLTVESGSGSGAYFVGQVVGISADPATTGTVFNQWIGDIAGVADVNAASTTVTMTGQTAVTATYSPLYSLTVESGSGSGVYADGTVVSIKASRPQNLMEFAEWIGDTGEVADITATSTTITMAGDASVTATYATRTFTLTVVGGSGSGQYAVGELGTISADPAPNGMAFLEWEQTRDVLTDLYSPNTTFTMAPGHVTVTAIYGLGGDCDQNGTVNVLDLNYVLRDWGKTQPDLINPIADLNGDGVVDIIDLNMVLINWGKTAQP